MSEAAAPGPAVSCLAAYELLTAGDYWQVSQEQLAGYLQSKLEGGDQEVVGGDETAVGVWRELDFDSRIFKRKMGRIDWGAAADLEAPGRERLLGRILEDAAARGVEHLTYRISALDPRMIQAAEAAGFRTTTVFVGLVKKIEGDGDRADPRVRVAGPDDLEALQQITREAFARNTRFHFDPGLPATDTARMHQCWIENCLAGWAADMVLVAVENGRVVGYITGQVDSRARLHLGEARASIGLFAVATQARGQGLGRALLHAAQRWLGEHAVERAEVGTESINFSALQAYLRAGFRIVQSSLTLHRWAGRT